MMYTIRETKEKLLDSGLVSGELTDDQKQYITEKHSVVDNMNYYGKICKFTGTIYGIFEPMSHMLTGYLVQYKTSTGKKLYTIHYRL